MYFIIIGASHIGIHLLNSIIEKGDSLTVIDRLEETCKNLAKQYPNIRTVFGDGTEIDVLEEAMADRADAVVAATSSDAVNLTVCEHAKNIFRVPHVIAVLNNPKNRKLFEERMVADTFVSPTEMVVTFFERAVKRHDVVTLLTMKSEDYKFAEYIIFPNSDLLGMTLSQIGLPEECRIGMVKREDRTIFPDEAFVFEAHDRLFLLGTVKGVNMGIEVLRSPLAE